MGSGKYKGQGFSNLLLEACISDSRAKGKKGLVILSSKKKRGFLSEQKYLQYKGFETMDTAVPYFELMVLPFDKDTEKPHFKSCVKQVSPADVRRFYLILYKPCLLQRSMFRFLKICKK